MAVLPHHDKPLAIRGRSKAPFAYFGGKSAMIHNLLPLLPPHEVYVDVCGGSGALLFAKDAAELEVFNDADSALVNFFRVLRDREQCAELVQLLDLSPFSREDYLFCRIHYNDSDDDIERARRWYIAAQQAFSGHFGRSGWKQSKTTSGHAVKSFRHNVERFSQFTDRMRYVQIENLSFERIIHDYDAEDVLFYVDPPYVPETRRDGGYRHEMTVEQHRHLLQIITTCKGMVILSGYDNPLYRSFLGDWQLHQFEVTAHSVAKTKATGLQGKGAMKEQTRTESVWIKPNTIKHPKEIKNLTLW